MTTHWRYKNRQRKNAVLKRTPPSDDTENHLKQLSFYDADRSAKQAYGGEAKGTGKQTAAVRMRCALWLCCRVQYEVSTTGDKQRQKSTSGRRIHFRCSAVISILPLVDL